MGNASGTENSGAQPQHNFSDLSKPRVEVLPAIAEEDFPSLSESMEISFNSSFERSFSSLTLVGNTSGEDNQPKAMDISMTSGMGDSVDNYGEYFNTSQKQRSSIKSVSPIISSGRRITPTISASTSFDERFKYKISIYSKVSGCRMTNLPDYTIVKQIRVAILQHITHGNPHEVLLIKFAYEKMKNGGLQVITDDKRLSETLSGLSYFATIPCKMTFPNNPRVVGFVKDLPVNMEPAELKREIRKQLPEVYSVRYITERMGGRSRPSQRPCAFISFNLRYLPGSILIYGKVYEIMVPNPMQCTRCCRYGHQGKQCRAEIRCGICGKQHPKQHCDSGYFRCVNCKGNHASTSHECLVWQQGKTMNELRYRGGLTAEEAIDVASDGKIQHKKHRFVSPDEYFDNQESFYLDGGSGDGSSDDIDVLNSTVIPVEINEDPSPVFNCRFMANLDFLDIFTDFYLKLTNPTTKDISSSILMPGFEEESIAQRLSGHKKPSLVAQQFKISVLQTLGVDEQPATILNIV